MLTSDILLTLGIIIIVGYLGRLAYSRTKVPESLFMMIIGLIIGPILNLIQPEVLLPAVPFFSVLALILVLMDTSLELNIFKVLRGFHLSIIFTLCVALISTFTIGLLIHYLFGWNLLHAMFLGLISSGTTTVAATSLLALIKVDEKVRNFIFLETMINDFAIIFGASIILLFLTGQYVGVSSILQGIVSTISIALVLGAFGAYVWIGILKKAKLRSLNYISSIGALFITYGLVERLGGDGILSALIFSFLLGNYFHIYRKLDVPSRAEELHAERPLMNSIRFVNDDVSFLVRIFFFVLLGAVFDVKAITVGTISIVLATLMLLLIARYISLLITSRYDRSLMRSSFIIVTMIPRGFVATVFAFIPSSIGIYLPSLPEVILMLVMLSNVFAITAGFFFARRLYHPPNPQKIKDSKRV